MTTLATLLDEAKEYDRTHPVNGGHSVQADQYLAELTRRCIPALTTSEARVKLLEDALREIEKCGTWPSGMLGNNHEALMRARELARSALGDVTATKGEAK